MSKIVDVSASLLCFKAFTWNLTSWHIWQLCDGFSIRNCQSCAKPYLDSFRSYFVNIFNWFNKQQLTKLDWTSWSREKWHGTINPFSFHVCTAVVSMFNTHLCHDKYTEWSSAQVFLLSHVYSKINHHLLTGKSNVKFRKRCIWI